MEYQTIIIPGLRGSGAAHWQSWIQDQIPYAIRVEQNFWDQPLIIPWARKVQQAINASDQPVILIAHSFGVLASVVGAAQVSDKVAGALYVAPADPSRFSLSGERLPVDEHDFNSGLYNHIPKEHLGYQSILVASLTDPCILFKRAAHLASLWHSRLESAGNAGHINTESGFGPWYQGLELFKEVKQRALNVTPKLPFHQSWAV